MYQAHFGLNDLPFSFSPSTYGLFMSAGHREGFAALEWGLREPSGFTILIGEAGTGKTTLIHSLLEREYPGVRAARIVNPTLSFEEILRSVMQQLGMAFADLDKSRLLQAFAASIARMTPAEKVALILDEAQDLSNQTLEELRLLSNFDVATPSGSIQAGPSHKALQIILVGQLELAQRLKSSKLHQLDQRIGARAVLPPLRSGEIYDYIDYRVRALGGEMHRLFKAGALRALACHSGGIPRRINVLCHNALMQAFAQGARRVNTRHVEAAIADYENLPARAQARGGRRNLARGDWVRRRSSALPAAFAVSVLVIGTGWSALRWRSGDAASNLQPVGPQAQTAPSKASATLRPEPDGRFYAKTSSPPPASSSTIHHRAPRAVVVKSGDTLGKIAQKYFGSDDPAQISRLLKANPQLPDADTIFPGQMIALDPGEKQTRQEDPQ